MHHFAPKSGERRGRRGGSLLVTLRDRNGLEKMVQADIDKL
jgi:hypothetical protein